MKNLTWLLIVASAAFAQTERRSFQGVKTVVVDNVIGSIDVEGVAGTTVDVEATRKEERSSARNAEVKLDMRQEGDKLILLVDGPFRCKCGDGSIHMRGDDDLHVRYDFKLRVPRDARVELKTVTSGDVKARNLAGDFKVRNVNGAIDMTGISGSGEAHTVNGKVNVAFDRKPTAPCSFKSVNGKLTISGPADFGGDARIKTLNGGIYTDYDVTSLPVPGASGERHGTKWVYRSNAANVRLGSGGPEMKFETLNGDVIVERTK
jgi:hypothetical protein